MIESNPVILKAVNDAIQRGSTIDAITDMLAQMGHEIGRSSVGVHSKKLKAMSDRSRDIRAAADAFASKFGDAGDNQTRPVRNTRPYWRHDVVRPARRVCAGAGAESPAFGGAEFG